jgi:hypothetical protein
VKFIPILSTTPRILREATIADTHLQIIFDPKEGKRYLSVGVGDKTIRRIWLKPEQATELLVMLATLSPEWGK